MIDFHRINQNLHIVLDCDDVLLDWLDGFKAYVSDVDGREITGLPSSWDMSEWLGVTSDHSRKLVFDFNNSQHFAALKPCAGAIENLVILKEKGHRLTVLTSCSDDPTVVARRRENLDHVFGSIFEQVICLPLGQSKKNWLSILERGIWVEDNYSHALSGHDCGHRTFMVRRSHNRSHETPGDAFVTWIDDLRPLVSPLS